MKVFSYEELDPNRLAHALKEDNAFQVRMTWARCRLFLKLASCLDAMMGRQEKYVGKVAQAFQMLHATFLFVRVAIGHSSLFALTGIYIQSWPAVQVERNGGDGMLVLVARVDMSKCSNKD